MNWFKLGRTRDSRSTGVTHRRTPARPRVEELEERQVPTVLYYGGALLTSVQAQALYLGSSWSNPPSGATPAALDAYLSYITGSPYMQALTSAGYGVGTGTASKGAIDPTAIANNATITDASIQARIQADITSGLLQNPNSESLYAVYVEPNVAVNLGAGQGTTQQGILGYHGAFEGKDAKGNAITLHYAVIAYPGGTVGNSTLPEATTALDQLTAVTSHELAESVTDPNVNFSTLGWYDPRRGEIGDIEEGNPNAFVRLNGYLVQEVANQNDQLLSITTTSPTPPPAPAPGTVSTTTTIKAGPVQYHRFGPATETLTIVITPGSGTVPPTGTIDLIYDGSVLGTGQVQVVNGVAEVVFTIDYYANGSYTFTAQFVGTGQFQNSTSNPVTVNV